MILPPAISLSLTKKTAAFGIKNPEIRDRRKIFHLQLSGHGRNTARRSTKQLRRCVCKATSITIRTTERGLSHASWRGLLRRECSGESAETDKAAGGERLSVRRWSHPPFADRVLCSVAGQLRRTTPENDFQIRHR